MIPKFRAWTEEGEVMYYDVYPFKDDTLLLSYDEIAFDEVPASDFILMQSTGLFDKNGKEIFEGDVVRYTWDMPSDVNATEKGKKVRVSKVFWSDWRASWAVGKEFCNTDLFRYVRNGNTVEIIGDIYRNPELVEVE